MKTFKTKNLYAAAAVMATGAILADTDHDPADRKLVFVFDEDTDDTLAGVERAYRSSNLQVNARIYASCLMELKKVIHGER